MPKYYNFMVYGYYLYFTSHCVVEAMHVHASDRQLTETGSAKLFVKSDGSTVVITPGQLTDKEYCQGFYKRQLQGNVHQMVGDE